MSDAPQATRMRRIATTGAVVLQVASVLVLAVLGIGLWRSRCEGFGCIGTGIAWMAWGVAYLVALVNGQVARYTYRGRGQRVVVYVLWLQWLAGGVLVAYWAVQQAV